MGQQEKEYREEMSEPGRIILQRSDVEQSTQQQPVVERSAGKVPATGGSKATATPCAICGAEQSAIRINVDGNTLLMESCDNCDIRRWQLEGERIDLQEALNQVGEHSGRRRSKA